MRIVIDSFRGEAPRITPRALPANAAQVAINARMQSGDLETWRGFRQEATVQNDPETIYLLADAWLSWEADVDVARGVIAGDTTFRTYLTGPGIYAQPRFTNYAMATGGAEPFPSETRPLGVPGPDSIAELEVGVDSTPTTFSIDVLDEGDELDTAWVASANNFGIGGTFAIVQQDGGNGNPPPCYRLSYNETHNAGQQPFMFRNFGVEDAAVVHASVDVLFTGDTSVMTAGFNVATSASGAGLMVWVEQGSIQIRNAVEYCVYTAAFMDADAVSLSPGVWYTIDVTMVANADNTQTVTARLFQGSGELASVVATGAFTVGGYCGLHAESPSDAGIFITFFDNIHVQASGSNGFTPTNLATSYVFTFVNDLGEESVPSLPSATVLRPDGVSVTVTTATVVPTGTSSEYGITTKRIYRAASGNTGTVFRFVAEIPLSEADYVDVLTDSELGEVLESEDFDLPPDDMRGILALPNGIMVGFSKNQLCLSAINRPHAWPVVFRLNTDTDIVAISNIDNTVVIGTQSYPYLATGTDPASYSMGKLEVQQACVAKRSIGTITGIGVVFASPDGLIAVQGPGQVRNLTDGVYTRRQWQGLVPETIRSVVHDDIYFFMVGDGSSGSDGAYALDMKPSGFGLIRLGFYADAMYSDPLTDKLFIVRTADEGSNDWLFFSAGDGSEPINMSGGNFNVIGAPEPFVEGFSLVSDNGGGSNDSTQIGSGMYIPLRSGNAVVDISEGDNWFAVVVGMDPDMTDVNPAPSEWPQANRFLYFKDSTGPDFSGWQGGTLRLYRNNDGGLSGRMTIITFLPSTSFYPPVSIEYFAD